MTTKKLYDLDSYLKECSAKVISCEAVQKNGLEGFAVELDQTCFFPEGGGQPADIGQIICGEEAIPVLYTYEQGEQIFHLCSREIQPGLQVTARIDFVPRFANMQIHSGEHILSGTILKEMGLHNVGSVSYTHLTLPTKLEVTQAQKNCRKSPCAKSRR